MKSAVAEGSVFSKSSRECPDKLAPGNRGIASPLGRGKAVASVRGRSAGGPWPSGRRGRTLDISEYAYVGKDHVDPRNAASVRGVTIWNSGASASAGSACPDRSAGKVRKWFRVD